jgi:hypothetical protein
MSIYLNNIIKSILWIMKELFYLIILQQMEINRIAPFKSVNNRYNEKMFEKFRKIVDYNPDIILWYNKWLKGVNYQTGRKIKFGGKLHNSLKDIFMLNTNTSVGDLMVIDEGVYKEESRRIYIENQKYDLLVDSVIEKVKNLKRWSDFVEFGGTKYGLPEVLNDIHRENDCLGNIYYPENDPDNYCYDGPRQLCDNCKFYEFYVDNYGF